MHDPEIPRRHVMQVAGHARLERDRVALQLRVVGAEPSGRQQQLLPIDGERRHRQEGQSRDDGSDQHAVQGRAPAPAVVSTVASTDIPGRTSPRSGLPFQSMAMRTSTRCGTLVKFPVALSAGIAASWLPVSGDRPAT